MFHTFCVRDVPYVSPLIESGRRSSCIAPPSVMAIHGIYMNLWPEAVRTGAPSAVANPQCPSSSFPPWRCAKMLASLARWKVLFLLLFLVCTCSFVLLLHLATLFCCALLFPLNRVHPPPPPEHMCKCKYKYCNYY